MFSKNWSTSHRKYTVLVERNVKIPMSDGVMLDADIFRPASSERFPAILGVHAYDNAMQSVPSMPRAMQLRNAQAEAGDPYFYARRGYVHAIVNARGTGKSAGVYGHYGLREIEDMREIVAWLADQVWCDGGVGMFGASYFSVAAKQLAATNPPALKAVWAPWGYTDFYRDKFYHGGILASGFLAGWSRQLANVRVESWSKVHLPEDEYRERMAALQADRDLQAVPEFAAAVRAPEAGPNPIILDVLLNPLDGPYWQERSPDLAAIRTPIVLGACWSMYALHLPGEFRAWKQVTAPKKLIIGPPIYLDRPIYQYAYQSLRWFDHWLKGIDTGFLEEAPVQLFVPGGDGQWLDASGWPLPQTVWHPFFLHRDGLLSEHDYWPNEGATSYEDNIFNERGAAIFTSPPMVERTEIIGPAPLTLFVSTSDDEVFLFVSLLDVAPDGSTRLLTRGWLRGSMAKEDAARSDPWLIHHPMTEREPMVPGVPRRVTVNIMPTANVFQVGHRIAIRVSSTDEEAPQKFLDAVGQGHLLRQHPSWISIHHDDEHPSVLHLPVTNGNRIGTYLSGGRTVGPPDSEGAGKISLDRW